MAQQCCEDKRADARVLATATLGSDYQHANEMEVRSTKCMGSNRIGSGYPKKSENHFVASAAGGEGGTSVEI
jgi:hypothetical protein